MTLTWLRFAVVVLLQAFEVQPFLSVAVRVIRQSPSPWQRARMASSDGYDGLAGEGSATRGFGGFGGGSSSAGDTGFSELRRPAYRDSSSAKPPSTGGRGTANPWDKKGPRKSSKDGSSSSEKARTTRRGAASQSSGRGAADAADPLALGSQERLQKVLAHAGVGSRRGCEQMILDGRVNVNGKMVADVGVKVDPRKDTVLVDGKRVTVRPPEEKFWVALHKPKGAICSFSDELGRRTVTDLVPSAERLRLVPVGRLDRDSAGLLLLTNDVAWVNVLTHPSFGHEKTYRVSISGGLPGEPAWRRFADGMLLEGETTKTLPCVVELVEHRPDRGLLTVDVTLREGRNRQLRRMFDQLGYPVHSILRLSVGPVRLGDLRQSEWRRLSAGEVARLKRELAPPPPKSRETRGERQPRKRQPTAARRAAGADEGAGAGGAGATTRRGTASGAAAERGAASGGNGSRNRQRATGGGGGARQWDEEELAAFIEGGGRMGDADKDRYG